MEASYVFLLSSAAFFLCITGNASQNLKSLKCHVCDSATDPKCADDPKFNTEALVAVDCAAWCTQRGGYIVHSNTQSSNPNPSEPRREYPTVPCPPAEKFRVCRKLKQSTTTEKENKGSAVETVVRTCGYEGDNSTRDYVYRSMASSKSEIFNCFTDGCNTGAHVVWSFSIIMGFLLLAMKL